MSQTIRQKVLFKNTNPKALYELYMDSKKHSQATGSPAKLSGKEGGDFSAHDGYITGKNLHLVKDQLIVQTWRGSDWEEQDADSVFLIRLEKKGKDTVLHVVHAQVPDNQVKDIAEGWQTYYWKPWKKMLGARPVVKRSSKIKHDGTGT
ncbi:MAG TPA: SRPBCC domain-containing protein [Bacteroidia bacterium]|jgi:activator of HSP90 ATPase|nr:SRPBCC domain-containing protein [Bacteroidia bacterium]